MQIIGAPWARPMIMAAPAAGHSHHCACTASAFPEPTLLLDCVLQFSISSPLSRVAVPQPALRRNGAASATPYRWLSSDTMAGSLAAVKKELRQKIKALLKELPEAAAASQSTSRHVLSVLHTAHLMPSSDQCDGYSAGHARVPGCAPD